MLIVRTIKQVRKFSCNVNISEPLRERKPIISLRFSQLSNWYSKVKEQIKQVGNKLEQQDSGPSEQELRTELSWLLEDAVTDLDDWQQIKMQLNFPCYESYATQESQSQNKDLIKSRLSLEELQLLWEKRIYERVPIQYLINYVEWGGLSFAVGPRVLIPRPETEKIVELAKNHILSPLNSNQQPSNSNWVDFGCGSGAISIGIAKEIQKTSHCNDHAKVYAIDISETAVEYTKYNAQRNKVESAMEILQGDWWLPLLGRGLEGTFQGVVSNPPYINKKQMQNLQSEVGLHEPGLALDGGISGLESIEKVIQGAQLLLQKDGVLIIETGGKIQCEEVVSQCLDQKMWSQIEIIQDCYGIERFVMARYAQ